MSDSIPTLSPGTQVGEYEVQAILGKGGMGTVYAGVHPKIGKKVAIKVLNPEMADNADVIARFVQEARSVNQIGHKNIIDIFAFGDLPNRAGHYFVMERLEGESLASRIQRDKRIAGTAAIAILEQIANAIDAAHGHGIWHRDLKPDNVFLVPDRGGPQVKVLDFGIAKLTEGAVAAATRTGVPMGTPLFMSPEQWKGREVDHRTDIYALAIVAFVMLTGAHPFEADSFPSLMYMHLQETPPPPSSKGAPTWSDAPILAGLAKDKSDRPSSAGDFVASLRRAMERSGVDATVAPSTPLPQAPRPDAESKGSESRTGDYFASQGTTLPPVGARRGWMIGAGAVIAVGIAVGAGIFVMRGGSDEASRVLTSTPAPERAKPDAALEAKLAAASAAVAREDWREATALANQALGLAPDHPGATLLIAKAADESRAQLRYERFANQLTDKQLDTASATLRDIPQASVYHARAARELDAAIGVWLETQLASATQLAVARRCTDLGQLRKRIAQGYPERAAIIAALDEQLARCTGKRATASAKVGQGSSASPAPQPTSATSGSSGSGSGSAESTTANPDKVKF